MAHVLRVDMGHAELSVDGGSPLISRDVSKDATFFRDLNARYLAAAERRDEGQRIALYAIGRELTDWLEGGKNAWTNSLSATGEIELEVRGTTKPKLSADEMLVLRAPWELLVRGMHFEAELDDRDFIVYRRIGAVEDAPTPDPTHRLGLAFMASSPRSQTELDFEGEELAILEAVGRENIDLVVEDSGHPAQLGQRLTKFEPPLPVVHISCHGDSGETPMLAMENDTGDLLEETAPNFRKRFTAATKPRLLMLSACRTATAGDEKGSGRLSDERVPEKTGPAGSADETVHSLTAAMVIDGFDAVLGWGGKVADVAATTFAKHLYKRLADGATIPEAVGHARTLLALDQSNEAGSSKRDLANRADPSAERDATRRDWHLARLWLGPKGGGPVVGTNARKKRVSDAGQATRALQTAKGDEVLVTPADRFVGRRRELQQALRTIDSTEHRGLLLHGMGRLGKSSLAAKIHDRRPDYLFAVVFSDYRPVAIVDALTEAFKSAPKKTKVQREAVEVARELLKAGRKLVEADPTELESVLLDVIDGPCVEADLPIMLLIDDFEQILDVEAGPVNDKTDDRARFAIKSPHDETILSVVSAFEASSSGSRLVVTSRYRFVAPNTKGRDLANIIAPLQLAPFHKAAREKMSIRQYRRAEGLSESERVERLALLTIAQGLAKGNPGLHDLLGGKVAMNHAVPLADAKSMLGRVAAYLEGHESDLEKLDTREGVREFIQTLAMGELLGHADAKSQDLLARLALARLPMPRVTIDAMANSFGGQAGRLIELGLLDPQLDPVPEKLADGTPRYTLGHAVNRLVAGQLVELAADEVQAASGELATSLLEAWGGKAGRRNRPYLVDIELARLGEAGQAFDVLRACAADAVSGIAKSSPSEAGKRGQRLIEMLDAADQPVPLALRGRTASALSTAGDGPGADEALSIDEAELEGLLREVGPGDHDVTQFLFDLGARQEQAGRLDDAEQTWLQYVEQVGADARRVAVGRGNVADILLSRGDLDGALKILQNEVLSVFEQLDDVRSLAVTKGRIAHILRSRGDLDGALKILQNEVLSVFEQLGEVRSLAVTKVNIAMILQDRGDLDGALKILQNELLPTFEQFGDVHSLAVVKGKIAAILQLRGVLDGALKMYDEVLDLLRELGDARELSAVLWNTASIDLSRGRYQEALPRVVEAWAIVEQMKQADGMAMIGPMFAQFAAGAGEFDAALDALTKSRAAAVKLDMSEHIAHIDTLAARIGQMTGGSKG